MVSLVSRTRLLFLLCSLMFLCLNGQSRLLRSYLDLLENLDSTLDSTSVDAPVLVKKALRQSPTVNKNQSSQQFEKVSHQKRNATSVKTAKKTLRTSTQRKYDNSKHSPENLRKASLDARNLTNKNKGKIAQSVSTKAFDRASNFVKPKTTKTYSAKVNQSTWTQKQDLDTKRLPGSGARKKMAGERITPLRFDQLKNKDISTATPEIYYLKKNPTKTNTGKSSVAVSNGGGTDAPFRKWAYAFLIGGCSEYNTEYRGFLYNVVVAAQRLRKLGSKADVVVFIQMSMSSDDVALPQKEERMLRGVGVKLYYLPKFRSAIHEVFYALVMEKFRILELTEYSRVLFLDADIMPLCSMDYIFELSEPEFGWPVLKENVVLSWRSEAANAGFFMFKPNIQDYVKLRDVIHRKEVKALDLPWPHWDEVEGWGHKIEAPDFWRSPDGIRGTNWTWHAVFADQGLLYHWTKYNKQSVSLIINDEVENWGSKNGTAFLEGTLKRGFLNDYTCIPAGLAPYSDFRHFTGRSKPWQKNRTALYDVVPMSTSKYDHRRLSANDAFELWYIALKHVSELTNVTFDFSFSQRKGDDPAPPVGRFSSYEHMIKHIQAKAMNKWTHYE